MVAQNTDWTREHLGANADWPAGQHCESNQYQSQSSAYRQLARPRAIRDVASVLS